MQNLICRHACTNCSNLTRRLPGSRNLDNGRVGEQDMGCHAAVLRHGRNSIAQAKQTWRHITSHRLNYTDQVVAWRQRQGRAGVVEAMTHDLICVCRTRGQNTDKHIFRLRLRNLVQQLRMIKLNEFQAIYWAVRIQQPLAPDLGSWGCHYCMMSRHVCGTRSCGTHSAARTLRHSDRSRSRRVQRLSPIPIRPLREKTQ